MGEKKMFQTTNQILDYWTIQFSGEFHMSKAMSNFENLRP